MQSQAIDYHVPIALSKWEAAAAKYVKESMKLMQCNDDNQTDVGYVFLRLMMFGAIFNLVTYHWCMQNFVQISPACGPNKLKIKFPLISLMTIETQTTLKHRWCVWGSVIESSWLNAISSERRACSLIINSFINKGYHSWSYCSSSKSNIVWRHCRPILPMKCYMSASAMALYPIIGKSFLSSKFVVKPLPDPVAIMLTSWKSISLSVHSLNNAKRYLYHNHMLVKFKQHRVVRTT